MTKMLFVEDDDVIKAISADGSDQSFGESILPGRSSRYRAVPYAHGSEAPNKSVAIRAITIPNDIAWRFIPAAGFGQLTSDPFGTRMCGHAQPQKLPSRMPQDQKSIQLPKRNRRDDEHVYRCDAVGMIAKEGLPALRRWAPSLGHVFCDRGLANIDPEFEQFAMNPWCSPQRVSNAHLENEVANVRRCLWPTAARSRSPAPVRSETGTMPTDQPIRMVASASLGFR